MRDTDGNATQSDVFQDIVEHISLSGGGTVTTKRTTGVTDSFMHGTGTTRCCIHRSVSRAYLSAAARIFSLTEKVRLPSWVETYMAILHKRT